MRRAVVHLLDGANDFLQFAHQVAAVLQASGGIDEQYIDAAFSGGGDGVKGKTSGVGAGLTCHEGCAGAIGPDFKLLDGRGAERVAGGTHDAAPVSAQSRCKLADGRRLARAVDAGDQDDEWPFGRVDRKRTGDIGKGLFHLARYDLLDFFSADRSVEPSLAEELGNVGRGLDAQ